MFGKFMGDALDVSFQIDFRTRRNIVFFSEFSDIITIFEWHK